eukprot:186924_1
MKMSNSNSPTLLAQQIHFIHEERARLKEMVLGDVRLRFLEKEILPVLDEMLTSRQLELAQEGFTEGFEGSSPGSTSTPDGPLSAGRETPPTPETDKNGIEISARDYLLQILLHKASDGDFLTGQEVKELYKRQAGNALDYGEFENFNHFMENVRGVEVSSRGFCLDCKFRHEAIKKSDSLPPMASSLDREDRCSQEFETTPGEDPPTHPRRSITPPRGSLADSLCARSHREVFSDMIERVFSGAHAPWQSELRRGDVREMGLVVAAMNSVLTRRPKKGRDRQSFKVKTQLLDDLLTFAHQHNYSVSRKQRKQARKYFDEFISFAPSEVCLAIIKIFDLHDVVSPKEYDRLLRKANRSGTLSWVFERSDRPSPSSSNHTDVSSQQMYPPGSAGVSHPNHSMPPGTIGQMYPPVSASASQPSHSIQSGPNSHMYPSKIPGHSQPPGTSHQTYPPVGSNQQMYHLSSPGSNQQNNSIPAGTNAQMYPSQVPGHSQSMFHSQPINASRQQIYSNSMIGPNQEISHPGQQFNPSHPLCPSQQANQVKQVYPNQYSGPQSYNSNPVGQHINHFESNSGRDLAGPPGRGNSPPYVESGRSGPQNVQSQAQSQMQSNVQQFSQSQMQSNGQHFSQSQMQSNVQQFSQSQMQSNGQQFAQSQMQSNGQQFAQSNALQYLNRNSIPGYALHDPSLNINSQNSIKNQQSQSMSNKSEPITFQSNENQPNSSQLKSPLSSVSQSNSVHSNMSQLNQLNQPQSNQPQSPQHPVDDMLGIISDFPSLSVCSEPTDNSQSSPSEVSHERSQPSSVSNIISPNRSQPLMSQQINGDVDSAQASNPIPALSNPRAAESVSALQRSVFCSNAGFDSEGDFVSKFNSFGCVELVKFVKGFRLGIIRFLERPSALEAQKKMHDFKVGGKMHLKVHVADSVICLEFNGTGCKTEIGVCTRKHICSICLAHDHGAFSCI